jgi:hypothetical protein
VNVAPTFLADVSDAFLAGLSGACLITAAVAAAGAVFAARFLPARADANRADEPAAVTG